MTLNIFGFIIQFHFSIEKDSLIQDLRRIYQTTELPLVPMIKLYRDRMKSRGNEYSSLRESKDYIDNLLIKFKHEKFK